MSAETQAPFDCVLVGGGLQNGLMALGILGARPQARIALVERDNLLGGNHTWCFHSADLPAQANAIVAPLVQYSWPGYEVRFPGFERHVDEPYAAVTSTRFDAVVRRAFLESENASLYTGLAARVVEATRVVLENGAELRAPLVIDARGPERFAVERGTRFQKFVGMELRLSEAHGLKAPVLMDARVPQLDGFRFLYLLPLEDRRILIEDTYYSNGPELDSEELTDRVLSYAESLGLRIASAERVERGVLPLPTRASATVPRSAALQAGYQGGWFHPTTGYSFPLAMRLAMHIAERDAASVDGPELRALIRERDRQQRFCILLNRLLFEAFEPQDRWRVLERFYRLPVETIRRFYALDMSLTDRVRILCGRPPGGFSLRLAVSGGAR